MIRLMNTLHVLTNRSRTMLNTAVPIRLFAAQVIPTHVQIPGTRQVQAHVTFVQVFYVRIAVVSAVRVVPAISYPVVKVAYAHPVK